MNAQRTNSQSGFTFIEAAISLAIFAMLLSSVFSIAIETSSFVRDNEDDIVVQMEANRSFERFSDILRKCGPVTVGGVSYPRVTGGGAELEFKRLVDIDGNGFAFNDATGVLEWDPTVYTLRADAGGNLGIYNGATKVYSLGRYIRNLSFQTILENPALHLKEIRIAFEARKPTNKGFDMIEAVNASVHMRN